MVDKLRALVAGPHNEHGVTVLKPVSVQPAECDVPVFTCFIVMGLIPPFSFVFYTVMETYGIYLAQMGIIDFKSP